ncbi:MAG: glycosyltransferase family 4 protein [Patescibacteria group bacterium]
MKLLLATGLYPPEIGGPATYAAMLEQELPRHGIEVVVVPFGLVRRWPKIIRHLIYAARLWRRATSADALYALDAVSVGLPTLLISRVLRKPFLLRVGGDYAWEQGRLRFGLRDTLDAYLDSEIPAPLPVRLLARLQSYVARRAFRVVVPSHYLKGVVQKWGVPAEQITVIYSALFPLVVEGTREELRTQLSYTEPTIVSAGRLVPWKGFRTLIDVVATLRSTHRNITLVIVGDGEERPALEAQVAKLNLGAHVRFTGTISKAALGAAIKAADVFVLNTAYEGLSHQLLEVMDLGTPIVTTTAGGNGELITDGVHGLLVPFNNEAALQQAILRIVGNQEIKQHLTQSARARSKEFTQEVVVEQLLNLFADTKDGT